MSADLARQPVTMLTPAVRDGRLSPVALTALMLERIERLWSGSPAERALTVAWVGGFSGFKLADRSRTSAMFFPWYSTSSVSWLYFAPLQVGQSTSTSGMNESCVVIVPSPVHSSQRPPLTLKLKVEAVKSRFLA